jgi:hypothetical protein
MRTIRKVVAEVSPTPTESFDVTTVEQSMDFHGVDMTKLQIKKAFVNTYGSPTNPNKQVKLELEPRNTTIDVKAIIEDFKNEVRKYKPVSHVGYSRAESSDPHMLVIALPDAHHGLLSWGQETGQDFDLKISEDRFKESVKKLLLSAHGHSLGKILMLLNGDILNSEGLSKATTAGTPQTDDHRWQKAFSTCWKMIRDSVEVCKTVADVELVFTGGNHDWQSSYYLGEVLSAWYENDRHVTVDNTPKHYKYKQYGNSMIGATHGDGAKAVNLPLLMATDNPEMWAQTKHRYYLIGHFHAASSKGFQQETENPGCTVIVCPAISSASDWTVRMGYRSVPEAQAFLFHHSKGRVATYHYRAT